MGKFRAGRDFGARMIPLRYNDEASDHITPLAGSLLPRSPIRRRIRVQIGAGIKGSLDKKPLQGEDTLCPEI
jgi:hypothetical protein